MKNWDDYATGICLLAALALAVKAWLNELAGRRARHEALEVVWQLHAENKTLSEATNEQFKTVIKGLNS
jgi:hypothetical protein